MTWIHQWNRWKKFFVYKCKLSLGLALFYLVDLFVNTLKTKFNNLYYRMILITKTNHNAFWRNFPARAKQMPSKVLFVGKKSRRPRPFGHCAPKLSSLATVNELKIIIFVLNCPTVLVYITIIHRHWGE